MTNRTEVLQLLGRCKVSGHFEGRFQTFHHKEVSATTKTAAVKTSVIKYIRGLCIQTLVEKVIIINCRCEPS